MMRLKMNFSNHWLMVTLNLSSDNARSCEEINTFVKEYEKTYYVSKEKNPQFDK